MSERRTIIKSAGLIGIITVISRVLGLVRDAVIASGLGAGYVNDCFQIAFEIPHLTRRVLGEGALSAFIVPVYTKRQHLSGQDSAWLFVNNILNVCVLFTALLTLLGLILSKYLFTIFGGLKYLVKDEQEFLQLGTHLTQIMLPYVIFLAVSSLMMGILHSHRHFTTPALGSVVLNITIIAAGILFYARAPEQFVYILAGAVMLGVLIRVLIMVPSLKSRGFHYRAYMDFKDPQLRDLVKMMLPAIFGLAIVQINISVDLNFANWIGPGTPTYIRYTNRLIHLPLAIFAASLSTAILPLLSKHVIREEKNQLRSIITYSIKIILVIFIPATVGLIVLGRPIIEILFERGRWTSYATSETYFALIFYALGLVPIAAHRMLTPVYYARQDLITPVKSASIALLTNIALNFAFFHLTNLRQGGLALATSLSSALNCVLLYLLLARRYGRMIDFSVVETLIKTLICSLLMGAISFLAFISIHSLFHTPSLTIKAFITLGCVGVSIGIFLLFARLAKIQILDEVLQVIIKRQKPEDRAKPS